jgi:hypothetical protein
MQVTIQPVDKQKPVTIDSDQKIIQSLMDPPSMLVLMEQMK